MPFEGVTLAGIDEVFRHAKECGRSVLYEHEVYEVLRLIGLEVPQFQFLTNPGEIDGETLRRFHSELVLKVVSPQIPHKAKLGGVKKVRNGDHLFIQFVLARMREEVLSHFPPGGEPEIEGWLLVEYIQHTQALGYEVLYGLKEDPSFGPVLTLSKGGEDAEFFAAHYDPANLFLPPLERDEALAMLKTLHIRHKFDEIGHPEYLARMAEAAAVLGRLGLNYSFLAGRRPEFILKELDINPFVIAEDGRFVAIDGFARFAPAEPASVYRSEVDRRGLESFFTPNGVAVVGVSADQGKISLGREIAQLLHDLGRRDIFLLNPKGGSLNLDGTEYPLYGSVKEIRDPVDLAVYAAPAKYVLDFLGSLAGTKIKAVILISGVPAEAPYAEFRAKLDAAVPEGIRVIGPNCMGVFAAPRRGTPGLNTFFLEERRLLIKSSPRSNTVLLTQSGALAVTAVDRFQKARIFRDIVSYGNRYDVHLTDLAAHFGDDPEVELIAVYLEGLDFGEGRRFFELGRQVGKPILVYKSGRTEAGARAAASHTASMTGSYEVFRAACLQAGMIVAETIEEFYDLLKAFSLLARRRIRGNRVAGVVNAGFESAVGADELKSLRQADLAPETVAGLNRLNRDGLVDTTTAFLDVTPMADDRMYAAYVEGILRDPGVDCVFVAVVPHAPSLKTDPLTCRDEDALGPLLLDLHKNYDRPMVVSVNGGRYYQDFMAVMEEGGLPVYTDIRAAIKSLDAYISHRMPRGI